MSTASEYDARRLRLLLFEDCNRRCSGCCNKNWNLSSLPVCDNYNGYDQILLTGGEPMLVPGLVKRIARDIRNKTGEESDPKIYMYTAKADDPSALMDVLSEVDGITLTLHTPKDVEPFRRFNNILNKSWLKHKSLRLNVFKRINIHRPGIDLSSWKVKEGIEWIDNCPLPEGEVFMRFK